MSIKREISYRVFVYLLFLFEELEVTFEQKSEFEKLVCIKAWQFATIWQYLPFCICHYLPLFATICHYLPFCIYHYLPLPRYLPLFVTILKAWQFATITHYFPLFQTICHYLVIFGNICYYLPIFRIFAMYWRILYNISLLGLVMLGLITSIEVLRIRYFWRVLVNIHQ